MHVKVLGHRGCRYSNHREKHPQAPYENSYNALEFALKHSMGLETDVIVSKQKTTYLTHDTLFSDRVYYELKLHLDQASKEIVGDRFFFQLDDVEIERLHYPDGQKFTRLDTFFEIAARYPQRIINLELKGPHVNDAAVNAVENAIAAGFITREQIILSSFNLPAIRQLREKHGATYKIAAILALGTQYKTKIFPDWPNAPQDAFYMPFNVANGILQNEDIVAAKPDFFHVEYQSVSTDDVDAIGRLYPEAMVSFWALGEPHPDSGEWYVPDIIERWAGTGKIYGAMTDFPDRLQAELEKRGLAEPLPTE